MRLSDLSKPKDSIEVVETYPFAIRNILDDASSIQINRHTGQQVPLHVDLELTTKKDAVLFIHLMLKQR